MATVTTMGALLAACGGSGGSSPVEPVAVAPKATKAQFLAAVQNNDRDFVRLHHADKSIDLNEPIIDEFNNGNTYLIEAAARGHFNLAVELAGYGADVGKSNNHGGSFFSAVSSFMALEAAAASGKSLGKTDGTTLSALDAGLALLALPEALGPISKIPGSDGPPLEPGAYISSLLNSVVDDTRMKTPGQLTWLKALVAAGAPVKYAVTFSDGQTKTFYVKDKINPEFMAWLPAGAIAQAAYDFLAAEEAKQQVAGLGAKPRNMYLAQANYRRDPGNKASDQYRGSNMPQGFRQPVAQRRFVGV